jgi:hypothetical protein
MYFALEKPLLDNIIYDDKTDDPVQMYATDYVRPAADGDLERVGLVVRFSSVRENGAQRYDITVLRHLGADDGAFNDKDSHAYVITEMNNKLICQTEARYADGVCIAPHSMNAVEHTMLLDELLAAREWQLASLYAHDTMN